MMWFPLYFKNFFNYPAGLVIALALGFGFGFVLERAGFGRAPVLAAEFYFTDLRVFKVMFTAIVVAILGVTLASNLGILDISAMEINKTYLWPEVVGGFILGVGFIVAGYCPGTSIVATASGNIDGGFAVLGVIAGSVLFGFFPESWRNFANDSAMGALRFPELLKVPQALVALAVTVAAIACFVGAEAIEQWMAGRKVEVCWARRPVFAALLFVAGLGVVTMAIHPPVSQAASTPPAVGSISPIELARKMAIDPSSLYIVDARSKAAFDAKHIPTALPVSNVDFSNLSSTRTLVVYDDVPAAAGDFTGRIDTLEGGFAAFQQQLLCPPTQGSHIKERTALYTWFTGSRAPVPSLAPPAQAVTSVRPAKKGGGC